MIDPTPRFNPLIDSIWITEQAESHTNPLTIAENLIFVLHEHANAYANCKTGMQYKSIYDVPTELQAEYFSQVEIAAPIITMKALAALKTGDPALAHRLFRDATRITTPESFIEPYFYSLMLDMILGEDEEYLEKAAGQLHDKVPYIKDRINFLLSRVDAPWWKQKEEKLKAMLEK